MAIRGNILVQGGTVIDPFRNFFGKDDLLIHDNRIVNKKSKQSVKPERIIDASDCLVLPGLIDYHTHVFHSGTEFGIEPDLALLPQGVTTVVDQGSAGVTNYDSFFKKVVKSSQARVYSTLHVSPAGLATSHPEAVDPKLFDLFSIHSLFEKYRKHLVGLKIRISKEIVGELGLAPLVATIKMAEKLGCRVVVHTPNPPGDVEELIALLRTGDVFTHMYHGIGANIINNKGKVRQAFLKARAKGILFDTADGRRFCAFSVVESALADSFEPDIISTDVVRGSLFERSVFGLPLTMSKYINFGIPLYNVVKGCTATPSYMLGMEGKIGTLAPGAYADVSIFRLKEMPLQLQDYVGQVLMCNQILIPQMTILNGNVVYRSLEF